MGRSTESTRGGVMQVVHRISSPEALSWSNRCRVIYTDFGIDYQTYALGTARRPVFRVSGTVNR